MLAQVFGLFTVGSLPTPPSVGILRGILMQGAICWLHKL